MTSWQRRAVFLVWGTPDLGPRSRVLARELGLEDINYVHTRVRRGGPSTIFRYPLQTLKTLAWLARVRPAVVFVQHPPSVPAWLVALYCRMRRASYVLDCHSATFQVLHWQWPAWLHRRLFRGATAVLVTDPLWAQQVERLGGRPVVIPDVPVQHEGAEPFSFEAGPSIAVVNTWGADEPIDEVVDAARSRPETTFYITGRTARVATRFPALPDNVRFTGFLSEPAYLGLLGGADAAMCLTTRDHTMQRGACEAMSLGTPVITSDWPLLRGHFDDGAVYVDNTSSGIAAGVGHIIEDNEAYRQAIARVREQRRVEWLTRKQALGELLQQQLDSKRSPTEG